MQRKIVVSIKILILFILIFNSSVYAQDKDVIISVLPFKNVSEIASYNYLIGTIQNSIHNSLEMIEDVYVIPTKKGTNVSKEINLNVDTLNNVSKILMYSIKTKVNVIVTGKYSINETKDTISITIFIYSVAKKEIIMEISFEDDLNSIFDIIDTASINTRDKVLEIKDELLISVETMKENVKKPKHITQPDIKDIAFDNMLIEWKTNKKTYSTLYIGIKNDFDVKDSILTLDDLSDDARNHFVYVNYDVLEQNDYLYYKAVDKDFINSAITSKEGIIKRKKVCDKIANLYNVKSATIHKEIELDIDNMNFKDAVKECERVIEVISKVENLIDIEDKKTNIVKLKKDLEIACTVDDTIKSAELLVDSKDYTASLNKYMEALSILNENSPVKEFFPIEEIENEIRRLNAAITVEKIIKEGDEHRKSDALGRAEEKYNEAIDIIEKEGIDDLISVESVKGKLSNIVAYTNYLTVGVGGGYMELNGFQATLCPNWDLSYTRRFGPLFSIGIGINMVYLDLFVKYSPFHRFSSLFYSEIYIKPSLLIKIVPNFGVDDGVFLGVGAALSYIMNFNSWGWYIDIGGWFDPLHTHPMFFTTIRIGIVYNF